MTTQDWIGILAVLVTVAGLAVELYRHRRKAGSPAFSVARFKTTSGWLLTVLNEGDAEAPRLWAELVPDADGRVTSVTSGVFRHVAVDAEVEFTVAEARQPTGYGVELCWVEGRRRINRRRVTLPHRASDPQSEQS